MRQLPCWQPHCCLGAVHARVAPLDAKEDYKMQSDIDPFFHLDSDNPPIKANACLLLLGNPADEMQYDTRREVRGE